MIEAANPRAQYLALKSAIDEAIRGVLEGGRYVLGEETAAFEGEFARMHDSRFGIGVGSGTESLHIALKALDIGPGDEVITTPLTAVATVAAIELTGASAVLVDVETNQLTIDSAALRSAINSRTRAVVPVHLYGHPADITQIMATAREEGIAVVEDCAQAHGARDHGRRVGSFGVVSCFSFYPTKNLGAIGDGGMVVTSSEDLAGRVRLLREYGWKERYVSDVAGWNTRLDELQAAILRVKLIHLDRDNTRRRALARIYDEELSTTTVRPLEPRAHADPVYHQYVVRSDARDELRRFLRESGVIALIHYPVPIHLQPAYRGRLGDIGSFPKAETASLEILSLPIYPELREEDVREVAGLIQRFSATAARI